jgi:hypothetical protein
MLDNEVSLTETRTWEALYAGSRKQPPNFTLSDDNELYFNACPVIGWEVAKFECARRALFLYLLGYDGANTTGRFVTTQLDKR